MQGLPIVDGYQSEFQRGNNLLVVPSDGKFETINFSFSVLRQMA